MANSHKPAASHEPPSPDAQVPSPPSEQGQWLLALPLGALGVGVLVAVLTGALGGTTSAVPVAAPPPVLVAAATPTPGAAASASVLAGATVGQGSSTGSHRSRSRAARDAQRSRRSRAAIVAAASRAEQSAESMRLVDQTEMEIPTRWMEGFYPIYATAQSTFGVNWLLIASIHKQESAFSTAPTTYHGLNLPAVAVGRCSSTSPTGGRASQVPGIS